MESMTTPVMAVAWMAGSRWPLQSFDPKWKRRSLLTDPMRKASSVCKKRSFSKRWRPVSTSSWKAFRPIKCWRWLMLCHSTRTWKAWCWKPFDVTKSRLKPLQRHIGHIDLCHRLIMQRFFILQCACVDSRAHGRPSQPADCKWSQSAMTTPRALHSWSRRSWDPELNVIVSYLHIYLFSDVLRISVIRFWR